MSLLITLEFAYFCTPLPEIKDKIQEEVYALAQKVNKRAKHCTEGEGGRTNTIIQEVGVLPDKMASIKLLEDQGMESCTYTE